MASVYDKIRNRAGGGAGTRAGVSAGAAASSGSLYDMIRNRPIEMPKPVVIEVQPTNKVDKPRQITAVSTIRAAQQAVKSPALLQVSEPAPQSEQPTKELTAAEQQIAKNDAAREAAGGPKWLQKAAHAMDEFFLDNPVGKGATRFGQSAARVFGITPESIGNTTVSTGSGTADKVLDFAGGAAGYVVNPAQIEANLVTGSYGAARNLLNTGAGQRVERGLQGVLSRGAVATGGRLSPKTTDRIASGLLEGSAANALQNAAVGAMAGQTDAKDIARNALIGGALGGAADAGLGGLATALKGTKIGQAFSNFLSRQKSVPPESAAAARAAFEEAAPEQAAAQSAKPGTRATGTLRNASAKTYLNRVMNDIREEVYQRMTPPLENETELAKWLQPHLGDVSLNEIRKLGYEHMRELAEEVRKSMELYDVAVQVARERGYNLEELLSNKAPSIRQAAERQRLGTVAGAYSPPKIPVVRSVPRAAPEVEAALPHTEMSAETPSGEFVKSRPASGPEPLRISPFGKSGKFENPEDTRTYIVTKTESEPIDIGGAAAEFYRKTVDNLQDINSFDKYVEQQTGKPLSPADRAYYQALNSRGSDVIAKHILTERMVDAQGNQIGESLKNITQQIPKGAYKNFMDYLIARHAETRVGRGEKVYDERTGMNDVAKIKEKTEQYEQTYPEFAELAQRLYDWNDKMTQAWLVDTGVITPEMWAKWKDENPYWVPNKRQFSKLEKTGKARGTKRGFASQMNPVKKYSPGGSERPVIDPLESLIEYVDRYVKTAKRNEVMQTIVRNLRKDPESLDNFAELIPQQDFASYGSIKEMNDAIERDGIDGLLDKLDQELDIKYNKAEYQKTGNKDNVVTVLIDGQRVPVKINDIHLLEALTNLSPQAQNIVIEAARSATNAMKLLTTGVNPVFSLTRNIFRDIPTAFIFSKTTNNPFRFTWDLLDGIVSAFGNRELYQRYKAVGGGHSSSVAADRNLLAQSKRSILPQNKKGLGLLPRAYGALENLSNVIETAPRLGEFKRITKAGGDSYSSRIKGLFEANDVTVNFKRKGQITKDADAFFPYLNAAVQGLDKFARAFKDNPAAVSTKAFLAISVPTIGLFALNYNNDAYKKLSNYTKDSFFLIPTTDGQFIKIPKPRELGIPFGSMLERTMRAWLQKDPESFRDFAQTVSTAFAPPGVPAKELASGDFMDATIAPVRDTILGPIVDVAANKTFTGAPVVPEYLSGVSPRYQYDANTSEVSKKIGDVLNVSPKQLDHLLRSYTGVIGQLGIPATAQGSSIPQTLTKQVTADPVFSTDATSYFYDLKDALDRQYADIRLTGQVPPGYSDALRKYASQTATQISDVTKAIRAVDGLQLTAKQKADKKRELTELRNNIARQAYQAVRNAQR